MNRVLRHLLKGRMAYLPFSLDKKRRGLLYLLHEKQNEKNGIMRPIYGVACGVEFYPHPRSTLPHYPASAGGVAWGCTARRLGSAFRPALRTFGAGRIADFRIGQRIFLCVATYVRVRSRFCLRRLGGWRNRAERRDYKWQNRPCVCGRAVDYIPNRNGLRGNHFDGVPAPNHRIDRIFKRLHSFNPAKGFNPLRSCRPHRKTPTPPYNLKQKGFTEFGKAFFDCLVF